MPDYRERCEPIEALFKLLQAKEVFTKAYQQQLANRLLKGSDPSQERTLATIFKSECGDQFYQNSEQMITDIQNHQQGQFVLRSGSKVKKGQSWSFLILDKVRWPIIPPEQ